MRGAVTPICGSLRSEGRVCGVSCLLIFNLASLEDIMFYSSTLLFHY
jgi:hypothetical protein